MLLTYQEETKQPRRPIADLPLFEFSPALESWSDPTFTRVQEVASFRRRFPLLFFIRYLYLSVTRLGCSLNILSGKKSLASISWLDTPLTANWLQVFVFGPESVLKCFWKIAYPTFKTWSTRRGSDTYLLQTLYGHIKLRLWGSWPKPRILT